MQLDESEIAYVEEDYIGVPDEIIEINLDEELSPQNTFFNKALQD